MMQCWHIDPKKRLTFDDLVDKMEKFLADECEYATFPVNEDYYKFFPKDVAASQEGPTPRIRKEDEYLEPIDIFDQSGFVLNCGIDAFRKNDD